MLSHISHIFSPRSDKVVPNIRDEIRQLFDRRRAAHNREFAETAQAIADGVVVDAERVVLMLERVGQTPGKLILAIEAIEATRGDAMAAEIKRLQSDYLYCIQNMQVYEDAGRTADLGKATAAAAKYKQRLEALGVESIPTGEPTHYQWSKLS